MEKDLVRKGYIDSPIGILEIEESDGYIIGIDFLDEGNSLEDLIKKETLSEEIKKCKIELEEYFNGIRDEFSVKVDFKRGTEFQKKVWNALKDIPYGKTVSYKDIACKIGNPKASRAVGGANNKNPISIIVPCHRVIGKNGALVGYGGGLDRKECLLNIEKRKK